MAALLSYSAYADDQVAPVSAPVASAPAPTEAGRITLMEEDDYFASHDDRHYTEGARASYLSPPVTPNGFWDQPYGFLGDNLPIFGGGDRKRKYEATIGQSIFTPTDINSPTPPGNDRPYAAWLYTGASLLQETKHDGYNTLENAELLGGVVGPDAGGEITQNDFHALIEDSPARAWSYQIHNEPGIMASYEKKFRFEAPVSDNFGFDAIPEAGGTVGNVLTYGEVGGMVRMGKNLAADYGQDRIRPSLSGTAWFDPAQMQGPLGWYVFAGSQGRAMGRNMFLQGNSFEDSPHVTEKPLVADFVGGASLFWASDIRVDLTVTQRTREFYDQQGHPDRFGGINVAFGL